MLRIEKQIHKNIERIIKRNFIEGENEMDYWNRHWKNMINHIEKNSIPFEIQDLWWKNLYDEMTLYYENEINGFKNKTICEIGAGSGYASLLMAKNGAQVTLIDFAPNSVEYAKRVMQYLSINPENVKFIQGDLFSKEKLTNEQFDIVWNCGVIEHYEWDEAIKLVKIMSSYTKPSGKVLITLPNLLSPFLIYKMFKEGKGSEIFFSHRMLKKLMEDSGLQQVKVSPINYWVPSFLPTSWANKMRNNKIGIKLKYLCWLFNGTGIKK